MQKSCFQFVDIAGHTALTHRLDPEEQMEVIDRALARLAEARLAQGDPAGARATLDEVLAHLDAGGNFEGTEHELRNYLVCVQVLQASDDSRAGELLAKAHTMLQARAARIPDQEGRRTYLENVPWHRQIVALWQAQPD